MVNFRCPICNRQLGKNEGLEIRHDAIGSLIVSHMVPEDIPTLTTADCDNLQDNIRNSNVKVLHSDTPVRSICGLAGFKGVEFA